MIRLPIPVPVLVRASVLGVELLVHRIEAWSSSTTFECIAKGPALVAGASKGLVMLVSMAVGCS